MKTSRASAARRRPLLLLLLVSSGAACQGESGSADTPDLASSALDRPFVVFRQRMLVLDGLDKPVEAPVTVGSRPTRDTLTSADPDVVEVLADGRLVARRYGRTVIHGTGDARLEVEVAEPEVLEIEGSVTDLSPGDRVALSVRSSRGRLDAQEVRWLTSNPEVAWVVRGQLEAKAPGESRVIARRGSASGEVVVTVRGPPLSVRPARARARPGQLLLFDASAGAHPVTAAWSTAGTEVLRHVGLNGFEALKKGRTKVCAEAFHQKVCADVEVVP